MTAENHDLFAYGGDQRENGDDRVLALFQDWLAASRAIDEYSGDNYDSPACKAAALQQDEVERQIFKTSGGATALAIKTFLWHRTNLCSWVPQEAMARFPELFEGECDGWENDPIVGILRSAAKQAPVLAELAAPIIHEDAPLIDANIDVGWCRDQLTDETSSAKGRTEVKDRLAKALDRIAKMEAKTPRGQEIKARHGAAMEQERQQKSELRQRADALVAEFDCPLPGGDAGLIEAERRITEITRRTRALYAEFEIDLKSEAEIINGIIDPVRDLFWSYIDETPPASLAGAAVKLRLLRAADEGLSEGEVGSGAITSIRQLAGFVEREASR